MARMAPVSWYSSAPVLGENGEFVGALAGMFRLGEPRVSSFYASIVRLRLAQGGNTFVVDGNGQILYDSGYGRIGETLDVGRLPKSNPPGSSAFAGQGGAGRTRDAEGNDVVVAHAPVPGTRWTLVSEDDWAATTSTTRRYTRTLLILLALGMVLPALGISLLVREQNKEILERERTGQGDACGQPDPGATVAQAGACAAWVEPGSPLPTCAWSRGNFHDFFVLPDGCLMLALADISQTGLPAAAVMATTRNLAWGGSEDAITA